MRVKVDGVKAAQKGLQDFILRHRRNAAKALVEIAAVAIENAVVSTPRYSGLAAFAWKMEDKPVQVTYSTGALELNYPDGLQADSVAMEAEQIAHVESAKMKAKALVRAASLNPVKEPFEIYVGNQTEYSKLWLDPGNSSFTPREVNQDFYTLVEIMSKAQSKSATIVDKLKGSR